MPDFLTRLIERSRGFAPSGQRVEPLIAPFYASGPNTAPRTALDAPMDEASVVEPEYPLRTLAPLVAETTLAHRREEHTSIEPQRGAPAEIDPARARADEMQSARRNQTSGIEPLPPTTPKSRLTPALLEPLLNARPGLTATDADQSRRASREPLMIRPQVARADESSSRGITTNGAVNETANKTTGETAAPVIRVTIGRVDVRAVIQSPPSVRDPAPVKPKLSLEEYLRSRSGRKG